MEKRFGDKGDKMKSNNKREIQQNNNGVAPLVIAGILGVIALIGVAGTVAYFAQPDITYNMSEGLFSIAGFELGGLEVIAIVVSIVFIIALLFKRK